MANERGTNVDTPGASFTPDIASQLPSLPQDQGALGNAARQTGDRLSSEFGTIGDELAKSEGKRAGTIDGNDPNFRPDDVDTLRGQAYDAAAQDTYMNNLQVKARYAVNQAYQDYSVLPQDQKTPDKLQSSLQSTYQDFQQNHVFPQIQGRFADTFDKLSFPYLRRAQDDHDLYVGAQARASFVQNEQSAGGNAVRAASLGTADGAHLAETEMQAHGRLVDEQVNQGNISPEQGVKLKLALRQNVLEQQAVGRFMALPDEQKGKFYETFSQQYGSGQTGLINPQFGDADAPLAFRNNNFTNIRDGAFARGQPGYVGAENGFARFATPEAALAAANKNLDSYAGQGLDTVAKIVGKWSPPSENDTPTLIANMARRTGFGANQSLDMNDPAVRSKLVGGLVSQETGKAPFSSDEIAGAISGNPTAGLDDKSFRWVQGQMEGTLRAIQGQASGQEKSDLAEIAAAQKQIVAGFDLPAATFDDLNSRMIRSPSPAVQDAMGQLGWIRDNFSGFRGKTPQEIETSIAAATPNQQRGTFPGQVPVIQASQGYLQKYRNDIASDPLRRAQHEGFIDNLTPIDFTKPAGVAAALALRAPQADEAARRFATDPPMLLPDEKAQLKKLATAGGQPMIDAAQAIVSGLGPRAGEVFEQAAGDAPKFATAGRVALWGGAPGFLDDYAERQRLAQDPATAKSLELPAKTVTAPIEDRTLGDALSRVPALNAAVRQSARDVFEKRALDNNYDRTLAASGAQGAYERTLQEAAGANFAPDGTQYGGVGTRSTGYFSSQKVLAPLGMRADRVGDAVGALTDADLKSLPAPPVAGDGKTPVPASTIAGGQLTSIGHGVYQVSLGDPKGADPMWVRTPTGQKFTLDLNRLEPQLRQRVPGLYRTP